jgi:hypothetical protein
MANPNLNLGRAAAVRERALGRTESDFAAVFFGHFTGVELSSPEDFG